MLLALVSGGYASYLSGTRGGWLAVPMFVALLGMQYQWFAHKKRLLIATLAIVVVTGALLSTERIHKRLYEVSNDVSMMHRGEDYTAVGLRLQLWNASRLIFMQHPVYGIGKGHLVDELGLMAKRGEVKAEIVNERAHSDFFSTLAEMAAIGVICLLAVLQRDLPYFWRHRLLERSWRSARPPIRAWRSPPAR